MSNVIRDVEKLNQRQIETAKRRNERELKTMEAAHQDHRTDLVKTQEQEIIDIQHSHHGRINQQAQKKEKILEEMRHHLQQTKNLTEKELKSLEEMTQKEKIELQQKLAMDRERINAENELYLEELNYRFNNSSKKVSQDGRKRIEDTKNNLSEQYYQTENYYQDKLRNQTNEYTTRFKEDDRNFQRLKDTQVNQFKKERLTTNLNQQTQMKKMTETHMNHIEKRDQNYRKGLKEQDQFFEQKYAAQIEKNNSNFKMLEEKNTKVIEDLKASLSKELTKRAARNDDPFYNFETLKPKFKVFEDRVEVSVGVPEHSKEDIQLTINGKEAIVSFNRRYTDATKLEDGTINKINKVESFTTRLPTGHFLDAKNVKSNYEDGTMTFVIKKA